MTTPSCAKAWLPSAMRNPNSAWRDSAPTVWLPAPPGSIAVFFPEDLHAPLAGVGPLHKIVLKVRV